VAQAVMADVIAAISLAQMLMQHAVAVIWTSVPLAVCPNAL
jgi:hypothetical protein